MLLCVNVTGERCSSEGWSKLDLRLDTIQRETGVCECVFLTHSYVMWSLVTFQAMEQLTVLPVNISVCVCVCK